MLTMFNLVSLFINIGVNMGKQSVVLETIKQMKDIGISEAGMLMFSAQVEDSRNMELRMTTIEKKVDTLDTKVDTLSSKFDSLDGKIDLLISNQSRSNFVEMIKDLFQSKWFWFWFMMFTALAFGVSVSELSTVFKGLTTL